MTREENILYELNRAEKRIKKALEDAPNSVEVDRRIAYAKGLHDGLRLLGYVAEYDDDSIEVNGYWIYHYNKIKDITGRKG